MRGTLLAVVCGLLEMGPTVPALAAESREMPRLEVRNPRPFGYVIGDRLEQQIAVEVPSALSLVATSLPNAGRATAHTLHAELRPIRTGESEHGRAHRNAAHDAQEPTDRIGQRIPRHEFQPGIACDARRRAQQWQQRQGQEPQ